VPLYWRAAQPHFYAVSPLTCADNLTVTNYSCLSRSGLQQVWALPRLAEQVCGEER
jgi:hypothetical protein